MTLANLYRDHVATLQRQYERIFKELALAGNLYDGVLIHSGSEQYYFADDRHIVFNSVPHFAHWLPLTGADHFLVIQPGQSRKLLRHAPCDFWYEAPSDSHHHWQAEFDIVFCDRLETARQLLPPLNNFAYIGDTPHLAQDWGIKAANIQPPALMAALDYQRSYKTAYEVDCLRRANALAARGHQSAKAAFERGASEREIYRCYLAAMDAIETETPYGSIIALNEKAAVLHYQQKRGYESVPGKLLLIDAGMRVLGYGSDITRTYLRPNTNETFEHILAAMEKLQLALVAQVQVGQPYLEIHLATHRGVAEILADFGLINLTAAEIYERGFTHPFFPHGVGHFLGIQVHDVAGRVADAQGTPAPPPAEHPFLRNTRTIEAGQVFTIEPGFYLIPMLLEKYRQNQDSQYFNWSLIDHLTPYGGIRIEDNIHVLATGAENLTRPYLP
jgi:Xaa-Pro dipeptidase